jgi:PPOX class probable F420-dependent enzyme
MTFTLDTSTDFGRTVAERIERDLIAWLTTVDSRGVPQPNPVWFLWHNGEFLIFSMPNQAKLANIRRSGGVSLNLNSTLHGGEVVIFTGRAEQLDKATLPTEVIDRYLQKYADGIESIGLGGGRFLEQYSEGIRVIPEKVRGF